MTIEDRIDRQKDAVSRAKDKYDQEMEKLDKLISKRNEESRRKIMKAFDESGKSIKEVLEFLGYDEAGDEQPVRRRRRGRKAKVNIEKDFE